MNKKMPFVTLKDKFVLSVATPTAVAEGAFQGVVYGDDVILDHITIVRNSVREFDAWCNELVHLGAQVLEAPCRWPTESCPELTLPRVFEMMMATFGVEHGSLVLAAPLAPDDLLSRHLVTNTDQVLHHIAVVTADLPEAITAWVARGFKPGPIADDGNLVQMFLRNRAGQLLELIQRRDNRRVTFSCSNIAQLRQAEVDLGKGK